MPAIDIVVEGVVPTANDDSNLRDDYLSFAFDQRAFGPRRTLVAFADGSGRFRGLAHTQRTAEPLLALAACTQAMGRGADAAVAFSDEPVVDGPASPELVERFRMAQHICAKFGVHLADWILCDDLQFRSLRLSADPDAPWWDVP